MSDNRKNNYNYDLGDMLDGNIRRSLERGCGK